MHKIYFILFKIANEMFGATYGIQKGDLLRVFVRSVIQHGVERKG
jgi:hypothetical protein